MAGMGDNPFKKCINPKCNLTYEINNNILVCKCGSFLDIIYQKNFSPELIQTFYQRRNHGGNIYNESGVWRFRELINFANLDTEDFEQCSKILVSLDGSEGRQSKPYKMKKGFRIFPN